MAVSLATDSSGLVADPFAGLGSNLTGLTNILNAAFGGKQQAAQNQNTLASGVATKTSPTALAFLEQILPGLTSNAFSGDYSKEAAIRDSMGGVNQILKTLREQSLPGVFGAEASTGGYNSTTKQLVSNDLGSRAVAQAQGLVTDTATKYAAAQSGQQQNLISAINAAVNAQQGTSSSSMQNVATTGDTTQRGLLQNPLAQGVAAALAGLNLAPNVISAIGKAFGFGDNWTVPSGAYSGIDPGSLSGLQTWDPSQLPNPGVPEDLLGAGEELAGILGP